MNNSNPLAKYIFLDDFTKIVFDSSALTTKYDYYLHNKTNALLNLAYKQPAVMNAVLTHLITEHFTPQQKRAVHEYNINGIVTPGLISAFGPSLGLMLYKDMVTYDKAYHISFSH